MANPHDDKVQLPDGYLSDDAMIVLSTAPAASTENSTFSGDENNDMSQLGKDVLPIGKIPNLAENYYRFDWKVGKSVHRKLLKKVNQAVPVPNVNSHQMKNRSIQRSLSIDSPRTPPNKKGDELLLKHERFKVRTINFYGSVEQRDQGTQGSQGSNSSTKSGSSK